MKLVLMAALALIANSASAQVVRAIDQLKSAAPAGAEIAVPAMPPSKMADQPGDLTHGNGTAAKRAMDPKQVVGHWVFSGRLRNDGVWSQAPEKSINILEEPSAKTLVWTYGGSTVSSPVRINAFRYGFTLSGLSDRCEVFTHGTVLICVVPAKSAAAEERIVYKRPAK